MEFSELIDLASERLGASALYANDEFFAPKENLLKASAPVFLEGKYTDLGKWMDGWESRRKRAVVLDDLSDFCIIRLGLPGVIRGVIVDTSFFRGNFPSHCSIETCVSDGYRPVSELLSTHWAQVLPKTALQGDSRNSFVIDYPHRVTHLRLTIYPDGGVARLRVFGEVIPDWQRLLNRRSEIDLAAVENGGTVIAASDMFFGHRHNLIMPGNALDMSDGWETKRRRGPGHDWCIIKLGTAASEITRVEVDTSWFKGNFPESCSIEICDAAGENVPDFTAVEWKELLPRTQLLGHTRHCFEDEVVKAGRASYARFNIFRDGGVSRLRLFGRIAAQEAGGRQYHPR